MMILRRGNGVSLSGAAILLLLSGCTTSIETRERISAPPAQVWNALTDFACHPQWNPFFHSISGKVQKGEKLKVSFRDEDGSKSISFTPMILEARPNEELRWKGRLLLPGLFDGEHYFLLDKEGDHSILTHGEHFSGILVPIIGPDKYRADLISMNQALKNYVESGERLVSTRQTAHACD